MSDNFSSDWKTLKAYYESKKTPNGISFTDFRFILHKIKKHEESRINTQIEQYKKELKLKGSTDNENELFITEEKLIKFFKNFVEDHNKALTENKLAQSFNAWSKNEDIVNRKTLVETLELFGCNVDMKEFFAPVGDKKELDWNDFCKLFKTKEEQDMFTKSFTNGFKSETEVKSPRDMDPLHTDFPIYTGK